MARRRKPQETVTVNNELYYHEQFILNQYKERQNIAKQLLAPKSGVSSKRFTAMFMILVSIAGWILDSFQLITLNSEITISLIAGGCSLLLGTVAEKFVKPFDINENREPTEQ